MKRPLSVHSSSGLISSRIPPDLVLDIFYSDMFDFVHILPHLRSSGVLRGLGTFLGPFGVVLGCLGCLLGPVGSLLEPLGLLLGPLGKVSGVSWADLGLPKSLWAFPGALAPSQTGPESPRYPPPAVVVVVPMLETQPYKIE